MGTPSKPQRFLIIIDSITDKLRELQSLLNHMISDHEDNIKRVRSGRRGRLTSLLSGKSPKEKHLAEDSLYGDSDE